MALTILDATTRAAVAAATNQEAQLTALAAPFVTAGAVTVRMFVGATHAATLTHGAWSIDTGASPRTMALGARNARTHIATGAPTSVVFRAGSTDIFSLSAGVGSGDVSMAAALSADAAERLAVTITASSSLPLSALPFTIPEPGQTANISLNNYTATNYNPATWATSYPNTSPWRNWCGAAFASGYSAYGAMVYWGGGHNGGNGTDAYVFDFSTALWARVGPGDPAADYVDDGGSNPGTSLLDPTWCDYSHGGGKIIPAVHTYSHPAYIPASYAGAGTKGQWILPIFEFGPVWNAAGVSISGGAKPHYIDLATGLEDRWTSNTGTTDGKQPSAGTIVDTVRGKVFFGTNEASTINVVTLADAPPRAISTQTMSPNRFAEGGAKYPVYVYVPEADRFAEFSCITGGLQPVRLAVYNSTTGTLVNEGFVTLNPTGLPSLYAGFGVDWVPSKSAFYLYNGGGETTVYKLHCSDPTNLAAATWTWTTETFSNPAWQPAYTDSVGNSRPHTRWKYIPALGCFAWCDVGYSAVCQDGQTHDNAMQLWRPN